MQRAQSMERQGSLCRRTSCPDFAAQANAEGAEKQGRAHESSTGQRTQPAESEAGAPAGGHDLQLKLAPILARRLEVLQQEQGTSSAKSSCTSRQTSCTSRSVLSPRLSTDPDCPNMPQLVRKLEGKGVASKPLLGSCNLSQVVSKDPQSPSAKKAANFAIAKAEVDKDLLGLKAKAEALLRSIAQDAPDAEEQREYISRLLDSIDESLDTSTDGFRQTIADIIDLSEDDRSEVKNPAIKALFTRLLFSLSRCSRLLITEQLNMFTAEPRAQRFANAPSSSGGMESEDGIYRSHTMPVKRMQEMAQQIQKETAQSKQAATASPEPGPSSSAGPSAAADAIRKRVSPPRLIMETVDEANHTDSGTSVSVDANSPKPTSVDLPKKSKGFFHKVKKTFRKTMDNLRTRVGMDRAMSGSASPASQGSMLHLSIPPSPAPRLSHPSSSQALTGTAAGVPVATGHRTSSEGKAEHSSTHSQTRPSVRFADSPQGEQPGRTSPQGDGLGPLSPAGDRTSAYPRSSRRSHVRFVSTIVSEAEDAPGLGNLPRKQSGEGSRHGGKQDADSLLSITAGLRGRSAAALDMYPAWRDASTLAPVSDGVACEPLQEEVEFEAQDVVCSVCEEAWAAERLEEHSELCAVLLQVGQGMNMDAHLTTLANAIEEQLQVGMAGGFSFCTDILKLIRLARSTAALQPDGSNVPNTRCASILKELCDMTDPTVSLRLDTLALTYARRIAKLTREKLTFLADALQRRRGSEGGTSGASTPRSAPGMSIDEFEIIKPISRGAFGRVYLARKLATKDLFAIKVMKKKDLIRKNMVESVNNERNILALANNPFVVRFYYSFTSRENLYIVMEYLNGGDFSSLLRKFGALDEDVARQYIAETVLALEYCHTQGIIHRDLKPDNILISSDGRVKLTDFGLSCVGVIEKAEDLTQTQMLAKASIMEGAESVVDEAMDAKYDPSLLSEDVDMEDAHSTTSHTNSQRQHTLPRGLPPPPVPPGQAELMQLPVLGPRSSAPVGALMAQRADQASSSGLQSTMSSSIPGSSIGGGGPGATPGGLLGKRLLSERSSGGNTGDRSSDRNTGDRYSERSGAVSEQPRLVVPEHEAKRAVGTPDYLAPELLLGTGHGPEVDWWALGAILFEYIVGTPPFNADSPEEIFENILDRRIPWPEDPEEMSPECRDLIDKLLEPEVEDRLGHRGAAEIKMHPWFKDVDWQNLAKNKAAFVPNVQDVLDTSYFLEKKPVSAKSMHEDIVAEKAEKVSRRSSTIRDRSDRMTSGPGGHAQAAAHSPVAHSNSSIQDLDRQKGSGSGSGKRRGFSSTKLELVSTSESGPFLAAGAVSGAVAAAAASRAPTGTSVQVVVTGDATAADGPAMRCSNSGRSRLMIMTDCATDPLAVQSAVLQLTGPCAGSNAAEASGTGLVSGVHGVETLNLTPRGGTSGVWRELPEEGEATDESQEHGTGAEGQQGQQEEQGDTSRTSPSGSSEESSEESQPLGFDPFQNFTWTNFATLSQANADKVSKLKQRDSLPVASSGSERSSAIASPHPSTTTAAARTLAALVQNQARSDQGSEGTQSPASVAAAGALPSRPSRLVNMDLAASAKGGKRSTSSADVLMKLDMAGSRTRSARLSEVQAPDQLGTGYRMPFAHRTSGVTSPLPSLPAGGSAAPQHLLQAVKEQLQARFLDAMASSSSGNSSGEHMLLSGRRYSNQVGDSMGLGGGGVLLSGLSRPSSRPCSQRSGAGAELSIRISVPEENDGAAGDSGLELFSMPANASARPVSAHVGPWATLGRPAPSSRPSSMSRLNNAMRHENSRGSLTAMDLDPDGQGGSPRSPHGRQDRATADMGVMMGLPRPHLPLSPHARSSSGVPASPSAHTGSPTASRLSHSGPGSPAGANSPSRMSCSGSATPVSSKVPPRITDASPPPATSPLRPSSLGVQSASLPGSPNMSRLGNPKPGA